MSVSLRKKHPNGEYSMSEETIDRNNFAKIGNRVRLLYGWKPGDNNRRTWLDYEYRVVWSLQGGGEIVEDWKPSSKGQITLSSPCKRRFIEISGDIEKARESQIKNIQVKVSNSLNGFEIMEVVNFNIDKVEDINVQLPFLFLNQVFNYTYQISSIDRNGITIKSNSVSTDILFISTDQINPNR